MSSEDRLRGESDGYRRGEMERIALAVANSDLNSDLLKARQEIKRLRSAGNALHAWVTINSTHIQQERLSHNKVLDAWEDACRER